MSKKKNAPKHVVSRSELIKLLKRHKKLKIVAVDTSGRICRERILTSDGSSIVRYPNITYRTRMGRNGYPEMIRGRNGEYLIQSVKFSRYRQSCYKEALKSQEDQLVKQLNVIQRSLKTPQIKKSVALIKKAMKSDPAAQVVHAMFDHDSYGILVSEVLCGKDFKKKLA